MQIVAVNAGVADDAASTGTRPGRSCACRSRSMMEVWARVQDGGDACASDRQRRPDCVYRTSRWAAARCRDSTCSRLLRECANRSRKVESPRLRATSSLLDLRGSRRHAGPVDARRNRTTPSRPVHVDVVRKLLETPSWRRSKPAAAPANWLTSCHGLERSTGSASSRISDDAEGPGGARPA
jgi:hypothetical protein